MARARDILLRLTGDATGAERAFDQVESRAHKFDRLKVEARAEIATAGARAELDKLNARLERLSHQEATPEVHIKTAKTLEQIQRIEKKLAGIKDQTVNVRVHESGGGSTGGSAGAGGVAGGIAGKLGPVGVGAVAAGAGAIVGIKSVSDAAKESEVSQERLRAQLKASNISFAEHGKAIDAVIQKTSKLSGLDDEDLQDAFTGLVRSTGSVSKGLADLGTVADIARAKNISVAAAGKILEKVHAGNVGALKRLGLEVPVVTSHLDKLKASTDKATPAQVKQAKELDKQATATSALGVLQQRFSGQAKAYGDTAAGAQDKFSVATENLREAIGEGLTPVLASMADGAVHAVDAIQAGFPKVKDVVRDVIDAIRGFFRRNREDIDGLIQAFKNIGEGVKAVFENVVLPTIKAALPGVKKALGGFVTIARGVVRLFTGIFTGDFGKALDGVKDIFNGAINGLKGILRAQVAVFRRIGGAIGRAITGGIKGAFGGLKKIGEDAVNGIIGLFNDAIKAINKLTPGSIKVAGRTIIPGIPNIPEIPSISSGGGSKGGRAGLSEGRSPRSVNITNNITSPAKTDPKHLAAVLSRQIARHP
jgi:hypothetical protein